ncbi:MAG: hemolysin family protein [Planctomycetota bacterium]|nr:hemolysin family protein [Planctomycetota bacterium]
MLILTELAIVLALVGVNGLFAMSEMALVSARRARLQRLAAGGRGGADAALKLKDNPDDFLAAVQIGITLIGIVAGAFGGASLATKLAEWIGRIEPLAPYGQPLGFGLTVGSITYLSLVLGELVPKRLALAHPEVLAVWLARPMRVLARLTHPAVRVLSFSTSLLLKLLPVPHASEPAVTEEELKLLMDQAAQSGVLKRGEQALLNNVLRLDDLPVGRLMTPRDELVWIDASDPAAIDWIALGQSRHTHFPVCRGSLNHILGMLAVKDIWAEGMSGKAPDVASRLSAPLYVPETSTGARLLELFKQMNLRQALVIDEYGLVLGIVTLNDILKAIVGGLPAAPAVEPDIAKRPDGSYLVDGLVYLDRLKDVLELGALPGENDAGYKTAGGLAMHVLQKVPRAAERFDLQDWTFEVVDMDGNRVDKLLVTPKKRERDTEPRPPACHGSAKLPRARP